MLDGSTIQDIVTRHLDLFHEKFNLYFSKEMNHITWVLNPFELNFSNLSLSSEYESTLTELSFDRSLI